MFILPENLRPQAAPYAQSLCVVVLLITGWLAAGAVFADDPRAWILVETGEQRLTVWQGKELRQTYRNISVGRAGETGAKLRGDDKTPLGEFRITRISADTPFHRFFAIDYPDRQRARAARAAGVISASQFAAIDKALKAGQQPPQRTPLGGHIGIHGIGQGDPAVHADFNWTHGCIALTNAQIDDLARWVRIGTRVVIRP